MSPQTVSAQDTVEKVLSAEAQSVLHALASLVSTDIAPIEARHASNREVSLMRGRGWLPSLQTLSAKFICRSFAAMNSLRDLFHQGQQQRDRAEAKQADRRTRRRRRRGAGGGPWRAFCHDRCAGVRFTASAMSKLAEEYRQLSVEDKQRYVEAGRLATEAHKAGHRSFPENFARPRQLPQQLYLHPAERPQPGDVTDGGAIVAADDDHETALQFLYQGPDCFQNGWQKVFGPRKLSDITDGKGMMGTAC